jgi:hypothetical protein
MLARASAREDALGLFEPLGQCRRLLNLPECHERFDRARNHPNQHEIPVDARCPCRALERLPRRVEITK